jgi:omega-amidase
MIVGLLQYAPVWENIEENILEIEEMTRDLSGICDLLVFPEMTLTGFTMNANQFAEEIDGTGMLYFMNLASRLKTEIIAGIIERDGIDLFNSLIHFDKNGIIRARYRKIHLFNPGGEEIHYLPGDEPVITKCADIRTGLSICYDLRFPELYRLYAKERVGILINIANWPAPRIEHWKVLLQARAIENQAFMIGVNRTGDDPDHKYAGSSAIFGPDGRETASAGNEKKIIIAEIDTEMINSTRNKLPFLNDMKLI